MDTPAVVDLLINMGVAVVDTEQTGSGNTCSVHCVEEEGPRLRKAFIISAQQNCTMPSKARESLKSLSIQTKSNNVKKPACLCSSQTKIKHKQIAIIAGKRPKPGILDSDASVSMFRHTDYVTSRLYRKGSYNFLELAVISAFPNCLGTGTIESQAWN